MLFQYIVSNPLDNRSPVYNYTDTNSTPINYYTCPCSDNFYSTGVALCPSCFSTCKACWSPSQFDCTLCRHGYFLSGNYCDSMCLTNHMYINITDMICYECDATCEECELIMGPANQCTKCNGTNYLLGTNCVTDCGMYFYKNVIAGMGNICSACNVNCEMCVGNTNTCT